MEQFKNCSFVIDSVTKNPSGAKLEVVDPVHATRRQRNSGRESNIREFLHFFCEVEACCR